MSRPPGEISLEVFSRRTSGIVREFALWDTAWYGILAAAAIFGLMWLYPYPAAALPGHSVPLAALLAILLMAPVFATYAGMGSAMPRMGGDYLFQSRTIHPVLGFSFAFAWEVLNWTTSTTTGGIVLATLGLQPMLYNLGLHWKSQGLMDAGTWAGSANGLLTITLAICAIAFLVTVRGLRFYRQIQRWFIVPAVLIANALLIVLLIQSQESFASKTNAWYELATGDSDFMGTLSNALGAGWQPPAFSLKYTFMMLTITGTSWYIIYAAQGLLGEIKHANSFTKLFRTFIIAGLFVGITTWILPMWLYRRSAGSTFVDGWALAWLNGQIETPAGATMSAIAMMMTSNPVFIILIGLGFMAVGFYFCNCVFLNMTRVMAAMGMDRTLPDWVSRVSSRYHAPVNAAIFFGLMAVGVNLLFRFVTDAQTMIVYSAALTSVGVVAITGLGAVLFPWRARSIYEGSPVARYKILGVPLIQVAGLICLVAAGAVTAMNLIFPELGFTFWSARLFVVFTPIGAAIWFYIWRAYQKRKGVNIDLAFRQVPPE